MPRSERGRVAVTCSLEVCCNQTGDRYAARRYERAGFYREVTAVSRPFHTVSSEVGIEAKTCTRPASCGHIMVKVCQVRLLQGAHCRIRGLTFRPMMMKSSDCNPGLRILALIIGAYLFIPAGTTSLSQYN